MKTSLPWLLAPVTEQDFISDYWGKQPLRIERTDTSRYIDLLPESALEYALYAGSRFGNAVEILNDEDQPRGCRSEIQAAEAFRQGNSLRIDSIQRFSHPILTLCQNLEKTIGCPVNVNMYLTPGAGKKALKRHYDTHDVFVLQIHGDKIWRLYDPPFRYPLEYLPSLRHESKKEMELFRLRRDMSGRDSVTLSQEFALKTGDLLYLPRGFWHEAETRPGEVSCHLTVGIQPTTYLDVLSAALSQVALQDERLREPLPFAFATERSAMHAASIRAAEIFQGIPKQLDPDAALSEVGDHLKRIHHPELNNNLLQPVSTMDASEVDLDTTVVVRLGVNCVVKSDVVPAEMHFQSNAFQIPPTHEAACRFISKTRSFVISDLPGELKPAEKLGLVRQLMSEGLLVSTRAVPLTMESSGRSGWLPIRFEGKGLRIHWIDFGRSELKEPFLHQSVRRFTKENPNHKSKVTTLRALSRIEEEVPPSGFIFHISRCGSTLVSNALRSIRGTIVISEPQPINEVLGLLSSSASGEGFVAQRSDEYSEMLRGLVKAYGQRRSGSENALIVKFSSWNILHMAHIRRLWPQVPCVVIIRDPVEVAVSCLEEPSGWMRWRHEQAATDLLGLNADELFNMSDQGFCARTIGAFLKCATTQVDNRSSVIDYKDLNQGSIEDIARFFGLAVSDEDREAIRLSLSIYSKDAEQSREFADDREAKQAKVTNQLRVEVDDWATHLYRLICMRSRAVPGELAGAAR